MNHNFMMACIKNILHLYERMYFLHKLTKYTYTTFSASLEQHSALEQLNRSNKYSY